MPARPWTALSLSGRHRDRGGARGLGPGHRRHVRSRSAPRWDPRLTLLLVALGAAIGAPLRYLTDRAVQARHDSVFPRGTLTVNVAGSFRVLGLLTGLPPRALPVTARLVGTGFCGALTTYLMFSDQTVRLAQTGARLYAVFNVVGSLAAGLGATFLGDTVAQALWG